jgi:hypothetical protein
VIDSSVVVSALARQDLVVTSDPEHLSRIAQGLGRTLDVYRA